MDASFHFSMPTRLVHGRGELSRTGALAHSLGMTRVLVLSDRVIARQAFFPTVTASLEGAGVAFGLFDECAIDARLRQVETLADRCGHEGIDGIVAVGGGSVMCCGKAVAIAAANPGSLRDLAVPASPSRRPLPTLMIPTAAGSGVEVSQFSVLKDEERHEKLVVGGTGCFPTLALLDPATLATVPRHLAAPSAVDALCHALEAYFSGLATPLTDAIAIGAARTLWASMRGAILDQAPDAQADLMLASAMANIACGNARLGLGHALSDPLESALGVPHTLGVTVLLPRILAFCAEAAPEKALVVADVLGGALDVSDPIERIRRSLFTLYDELGLQRSFAPGQLPRAQVAEMAKLAVAGIYGATCPAKIDDEIIINSPALRPMTVAQARACLFACLA